MFHDFGGHLSDIFKNAERCQSGMLANINLDILLSINILQKKFVFSDLQGPT